MGLFDKKRIFLDYASITPVAPEVSNEMLKIEKVVFANPSAIYTEALAAKDIVDKSRQKIADLIHAQKSEIIFTSGGTEGNNLAMLGVFEFYKKENFRPHIITTNIEHPAILEVCKEIERRGGEVTYLSVSPEGLVNPKNVREALKENTLLVTVAYANNEIGTIQPIKEISRIIKDYRLKNKTDLPYFHTDACQAALYLSLDVLKLGVDILTIDGIKVYGPKGCGILYLRHGVDIMPIIFGGGQERGLRSGTENVPAIAGLAKAMEIADSTREKESARLSLIRDYAIENILKTFPKAILNGSSEYRLPNNINFCFPASSAGRPSLDAEFAVISLDVAGISASYSSSCRSLKPARHSLRHQALAGGEDSFSYVVSALDRKNCSNSSLRFTLGRGSQKKDIDTLVIALKNIVI